jgi:hypothetical protein
MITGVADLLLGDLLLAVKMKVPRSLIRSSVHVLGYLFLIIEEKILLPVFFIIDAYS